MSDFRTIPLSRGLEAIVDAADYEALAQWKWHAADVSGNGSYARTKIDGKITYMHRWLLSAPRGLQVDHINHDKLDNRRANLRLCTQTENNQNVRLTRANKTGFKGVKWFPKNRRWGAIITNKRVQIYLGLFDDKEGAARAYDAAALRYFGQFAHLNFPEAP